MMGEVIEMPYRRVPPRIIENLIRTGYLPLSRRHDVRTVLVLAVTPTSGSLRHDDPSIPNLA
jgi:hypothetical protein